MHINNIDNQKITAILNLVKLVYNKTDYVLCFSKMVYYVIV